eukprot:ctg_347.g176
MGEVGHVRVARSSGLLVPESPRSANRAQQAQAWRFRGSTDESDGKSVRRSPGGGGTCRAVGEWRQGGREKGDPPPAATAAPVLRRFARRFME